MEKLELLRIVGENIKWCSYYGKQYGQFLQKIKNRIPTWSSFHFWEYTPKNWKQEVKKRYLYTHAHSNIIHNTQNEEAIQVPINRWVDEQNTVHITTEHHSALKRKGVLTRASAYTNLEDFMVGKISQSQTTYSIIPLAWSIESSQIHRDRK